ncbi:MAG: Na+/H+ antiporter NhaC [Bacteroidia bacterium]|nr:Na+/H+ antiporter NhaC [Bacteroidia bacterium]NND10943.1 Na+/H+ antiporter NhaC [Flavobacteriaceae bacterium]NNK27622.1 Na+/H+ antiporter NhaC [Flavobacteriaceae bacterium]RZV68770.1 MAG: Na+/H+ antiporter NhaC [Flavobacteriaceae bacterium]
MESQDIKPREPQDENIVENVELNIWEALIPVIALIGMLAYNIYVYGDDALSGSNQFILLMGAAVAAVVGFFNKVSYRQMLDEVAENVKSTTGALLILLMVGALAGTWMVSGVIPTMIYYGLQILNPTIFLGACIVICAIISIATGSSWTTSATVGIALVGIGETLGISLGMTAGAVLSGAYFGDKMSPLSDTTNLAPAMAGGELFSHIKYMSLTTIPTIVVTLIIFIIIGLNLDITGTPQIQDKLDAIAGAFNISPWLFLVPIVVIVMIIKKTPPLIALLLGALFGGIAALIAQPDIVAKIAGAESLTFQSGYQGIMNALTVDTAVETSSADLNDLFTAGGMKGMLGTIWLIICAMVFGGVMDAIGALSRITKSLLNMAHTTFGLFASTVASCLALNVTASDQYLALVVPGKMFKQAYEDRGLAPENLSRTLEDSGTVTSVLVPWNTCGAYHSKVLFGYAGATAYIPYAFFSILSPFMTLLFAGFQIKIKQLTTKDWKAPVEAK